MDLAVRTPSNRDVTNVVVYRFNGVTAPSMDSVQKTALRNCNWCALSALRFVGPGIGASRETIGKAAKCFPTLAVIETERHGCLSSVMPFLAPDTYRHHVLSS